MSLDFNSARLNMVQQQVRTWGVLDPEILDLLLTIPRELFVPPSFRSLAFSDTDIPIGYGQVMLPPKIVGRILQSIKPNASGTVLEVGTGTGYMTALLSKLAKKTVSIEIILELATAAQNNLEALHLENIRLECGDAVTGWLQHAPYDVIILTGSVPRLPDSLKEQLIPGGRLFAVVGEPPVMSAMLITRVDEIQWKKESLFETDIPPLINAPQLPGFIF